uniref:Endonuclease n=1 Tax=Ditylenchus dipsaci TaxID=166011 RepID=A0A915CSQ3_9BILA
MEEVRRKKVDAPTVVEHLTPDRLVYDPSVGRSKSTFKPDTSIHTFFQSQNSDYLRSGYDRGHLAAAGNHRKSRNSIDQTFFLTNMSPQVGRGFNRDKWNDVEIHVRRLAKKNRNVYICTGPLYLPQKESDGNFYLDEIARLASPNTIRMPSSLTTNTLIMNGDAAKETAGLNAGIHEFKFSFKLPEEQALYTSFDARNSAGCVRYYIIVQAFNSGHSTLKRKLLFPVKSKVLEKGNVTAKLHLKKRGYVPGEPLQGQITIEIVHKVCQPAYSSTDSLLFQKTRDQSARELLRDARNGLAHPKILANSSLTYPIKFYVPALLPNLSVPECIEADYCLCLDVDWKRLLKSATFCKSKYSFYFNPNNNWTHPTNELPGQISDLPPPPYEEKANGVTQHLLTVVEHLTPDRLVYDPSVGRSKSTFKPDTSIHTFFQSQNSDYPICKLLDRGHLAAAGNHRKSRNSIDQTFFLTNMSPQVGRGFNRDKWNDVEIHVRRLAKKNRNVYICTGPLYLPQKESDGNFY